MSYTERLAAELNNAKARETFAPAKVYDWSREAGQKRSIR